MRGRRPSTASAGRAAEQRAIRALEQRGYRVLDRNYRCAEGELDAVALDGETLVFVEIRSRGDARHGTALEQVGAAKQRQVARVARAYLRREKPRGWRACRFDVVGITGGELTIVPDAFRIGV